jgi:WD40 repeat protein
LIDAHSLIDCAWPALLDFVCFTFCFSFCVKTYHDVTSFSNSKFCLPAHFSTLHHPKQYIFSGSEDGAVVLWEVVSMEVVARLIAKPAASSTATATASSSPVLCVAVHPTLPVLASSNMEPPFAITLWAHQRQ